MKKSLTKKGIELAEYFQPSFRIFSPVLPMEFTFQALSDI